MKEIVQHPVHGEIVYNESFWTGKKALTINGVIATPIAKNQFALGEEKIVLSGSFLTGIKIYIDNSMVEISPKPKWYEIVLAVIPVAFLLTWGNSAELCSIFPVVGGALGGGLGALGSMTSLFFMKKSKSPLFKILIGLGALVATVLIAFVLALLMISLIA